MHRLDASARRLGLQALDIGAGDQGEIVVPFPHGVDADHLGVGLGVDGTGEAIERVAADAGRARRNLPVLLLEQDAERQMKWMQPGLRPIVRKLLNAWLVAHGRMRVRRRAPRLVRILAALAADLEQRFGLAVIRFEHVVFQRPCWRDAIVRGVLFEIFFAKPKQGRAINFRITANPIMQAGMKAFAFASVPSLRRLIGAVDENSLRVPILLRAR